MKTFNIKSLAFAIALVVVGNVWATANKKLDKQLLQAVRDGKRNHVQHLIHSKWANPKMTTDKGETLLHFAAYYGYIDIVKDLIIAAPELVNTKDSLAEQTPLFLAIENGHGKVVKILIKAGANIQAKDEDGETPLDLLAKIVTKNK